MSSEFELGSRATRRLRDIIKRTSSTTAITVAVNSITDDNLFNSASDHPYQYQVRFSQEHIYFVFIAAPQWNGLFFESKDGAAFAAGNRVLLEGTPVGWETKKIVKLLNTIA